MKRSWGLYAAPIMLMMIVSCGRQEQKSTELPPAAPSPAAGAPAAPAGQYEATTVTDGGGIAGTITLSGALPKLPQHKTDKDPQVCGTTPRESEKLLVSKGGGVKNAVVMVLAVNRGKAMPAAAQNARCLRCRCLWEVALLRQIVPPAT